MLHIRLLCVSDLQQTLDVKFTTVQWQALSPKDTLDAVEGIMVRATNYAVRWSLVSLKPSMSLSVHFLSGVLTMLWIVITIGRVASATSRNTYYYEKCLCDSALKQEVSCHCHMFGDVDSLRAFCLSLEAAQRDYSWRENAREYESAGVDGVPDDVSDNATSRRPTAAASRHSASDTHRSYPNCRYKHAPDKGSCPVERANCVACGKARHFKRSCRSSGKRGAGKGVNSVTHCSAGIAPEPLL